jgi:hypothetical protein
MKEVSVKRHAILASVIALGLALAACSSAGGAQEHQAAATPTAETVAGKADPVEFRHAVRKLWEDHITWTRMFIVSAAAGLKDQHVAAERLLRNQDDIGDAIKPYYGEAAGEQLTKLLREHILIAADLLAAAKAGVAVKVEKVTTTWYANADEISAFLAKANPTYWPLDAVKHHMRTHLDLTLEEAVARLKGNWAADVAAYDKVHVAILEMSDALAAGIVGQFPEKFA